MPRHQLSKAEMPRKRLLSMTLKQATALAIQMLLETGQNGDAVIVLHVSHPITISGIEIKLQRMYTIRDIDRMAFPTAQLYSHSSKTIQLTVEERFLCR